MSKTKIIFHAAQQFIELDADAIQQHNFDYSEAITKATTSMNAGEHVTMAPQQTGVINFLPATPDYAQTPPVHTVSFTDFTFTDSIGRFYKVTENFNFDVTADVEDVHDFQLANNPIPSIPNADVINNALPKFKLWILPTLTQAGVENRNFIQVNVQVQQQVATREVTTFTVRIAQNSPGVGYLDCGQVRFVYDTGRTTPAISGLTVDRDILSESLGAYTNASNTRNRLGVIPRLSQRLGDVYDTVIRAGRLDPTMDAFTQDRTLLPRLSLAGLEARQSVLENQSRQKVYPTASYLNVGNDVGGTEKRGVVSKIASCSVRFAGTSVPEPTNTLRTTSADFNNITRAPYQPHFNKIFMASAHTSNPGAAPHGFGNFNPATGTAKPILHCHNYPSFGAFYLRLDDDFNTKYFITDVQFSIERSVSGGNTAGQSCMGLLQFFNVQNSGSVSSQLQGNNYIQQLAYQNLFTNERASFDTTNSAGITNSLSDATADNIWQNITSEIGQFIQINTSLIMPAVNKALKDATFLHNQTDLEAQMTDYYTNASTTFDNTYTDGNGDTQNNPVRIYPDFVLKVHVYGYSRFYERAGIESTNTTANFTQHSEG